MSINLIEIKEILPQALFIIVLFINFLTALVDRERNITASLIATGILLGLTYWGGFYTQLFEVIK